MNKPEKQMKDTANGKGDFPRFNYQTDNEYKKNYDAIDWGKKK